MSPLTNHIKVWLLRKIITPHSPPCLKVLSCHDDVIKWKHFPRHWPLVRGTGEFLAQRSVTRSFDVFFDLRLNKQLSKESRGWWFETPSRSLWRQCHVQTITANLITLADLRIWYCRERNGYYRNFIHQNYRNYSTPILSSHLEYYSLHAHRNRWIFV